MDKKIVDGIAKTGKPVEGFILNELEILVQS